jgi:predicted tellurium resistance membrane protein TerC
VELLLDPNIWIAFVTLAALEIVLGIDNVIFISILAAKLPREQQERARKLGLALAAITRLLLLFSLAWIMGLTAPLFTVLGEEISLRDLILIGGGLFLIAKSTTEIHDRLEGEEGHVAAAVPASFGAVIGQILLLDVVFSLDSIITAVGMVPHVSVMAAAIIVAVIVMVAFAGAVSAFVERHPTVKMLALSFLLLIGMALVGEGLEFHIPKGYIYFAMAFSVGVELLNIRYRRVSAPLRLHDGYHPPAKPGNDGG